MYSTYITTSESILIFNTFSSQQLIGKVNSEIWGNLCIIQCLIMSEEAVYTAVKEKWKQELKKSLSEICNNTSIQQPLTNCHNHVMVLPGIVFLPGAIYYVWGHLVVTTGRLLLASNGGCNRHLVGRGPRCRPMFCSPTGQPPQQRGIWAKMLVVLRLRTPAVEIWKVEHMKYICIV